MLAVIFGPVLVSAQELSRSEGRNEGEGRDLEIMEAYQSTLRRISRDVLPVVVEIEVAERRSPVQRGVPSPLDFFFGRPGTERRGTGSGVIVRRDGSDVYVLTNEHVAGGADRIELRLYDGREFSAELVGADENRDLALLRFETAEDVPVARFGDSDRVQVGDFVMAVGNPIGLESTITSGIVSALGGQGSRRATTLPLTDYIQTDAPINEGNTGGALVNLRGEVIGISTLIVSRSAGRVGGGVSTGSRSSSGSGSVGLGYAIPINSAARAIDQFIASGRVEYGWLGVNMADPPRNSSNSLGEYDGGAFVFNVYESSPASDAGIQPGDIIVQVGNHRIQGGDDLLRVVTDLSPGDNTRFLVKRNGETRPLYVTTGVRPDGSSGSTDSSGRAAGRAIDLWPGMSVVEVTDHIRANLDLPSRGGDLIIGHVMEGSPAGRAGLRSGDIIVKVNNRDVATLRDFYMELNGASGEDVTFRIRRNDANLIVGLVK
ncbi:MAG: trypsin-like peptidase domain-containing protein [Alkalispirochaeta sp.]